MPAPAALPSSTVDVGRCSLIACLIRLVLRPMQAAALLAAECSLLSATGRQRGARSELDRVANSTHRQGTALSPSGPTETLRTGYACATTASPGTQQLPDRGCRCDHEAGDHARRAEHLHLRPNGCRRRGDLLVDIGRQWRRGVGPGGCSRPTDGRGRITGGTDGSSVYAEFS